MFGGSDDSSDDSLFKDSESEQDEPTTAPTKSKGEKQSGLFSDKSESSDGDSSLFGQAEEKKVAKLSKGASTQAAKKSCTVEDCDQDRFKGMYCAEHHNEYKAGGGVKAGGGTMGMGAMLAGAKSGFKMPAAAAKNIRPTKANTDSEYQKQSKASSSSSQSSNSSKFASASKASRVTPSFSTGGGGDKWWEKSEEPLTIWTACKTNDGLDYYFNTESGETQWEKPEELMTAAELDSRGDWYWIPDETEVYVPGRKIGGGGTKITVTLESGQTTTVKTNQTEELQRSSLQRIVADLTLLDRMSAPLILHCLKKRFEQDLIYTGVGTILISVNPYQWLDIYNKAVMQKYMFKQPGTDMPPHVFNVAFDAYYGLKEFKKDQSIIISGESGAGKTEATKQCLAFIAAAAGSVGGVEKKVLQANPVLEAFGNAKTLRNDNSSRFGKWLEIFFDNTNAICGSATQNYLLEKIRVIKQADNERNFHIFYQLSKSASASERSMYKIAQAKEYVYLSKCTDVATIDDAKDFTEVKQAFKDLAFSDDERNKMFSVVSAILALGNLQFKEQGKKTSIESSSQKWLETAASLLEVEASVLLTSLTIKELRIKGQETTYVTLSEKVASDTRDALAKFMYGNMFDWLVRRINKSMGKPTVANPKEIGILDIFGFEIFENNSFEQLCINFTNEMLQQHFNQHTFKLEEAIYTAEKITFKHIEFIDNQPMIELITLKPIGILPLLDEELVVPRGSDKGFLNKMHEHHARNRVYQKVMKDPKLFIVKHYAGEVKYNVVGFLEKNRDTLTTDLLEMLYSSQSWFVNALFDKNVAVTGMQKKSSLSKQFQQQLNALMRTLNRTEPHYIRCIKPNDSKQAKMFVPRNCYEQLTYSGVFEAVSIRKQGFPFRLRHEEFSRRYAVIFKDKPNVLSGATNGQDICKKIISGSNFSSENVQMGLTMVLYRADEHKSLELRRSIKVRVQEVDQNLKQIIETNISGYNDEQKENYFMMLARAIKEADQFRIKTPTAEKARKLLEAYVEERMDSGTKRKLQEASRTMDYDLLEEVIAICDEKGYATKLTRLCRELLDKVRDAEGALGMAIKTMKIEYLQKALEMADEFGYPGKSVTTARNMLNNCLKAQKMLAAVKKSMDHSDMKKTIVFCDSFGFNTTEVAEVKMLFKKIMQGRKLLSAAKDAVEQGMLEEALQFCKKLHYKSRLVHECQQLCDRVTRINYEAKKAQKTFEEEHVRVVVYAASEIKLSSKTIKAFKKLVKGPYSAFLKEQYNKAVKLQDHMRAIRIQIKIKDALYDGKKSSFKIEDYPKLMDRTQWASLKFWGNKQKRAEKMLCFQDNTLHANLTGPASSDPAEAKKLKGLIQQTFESVQKWMMQRNSSKLDMRVHEILTESIANEVIRDEAYLAIIKQMNENPKLESVELGWQLLGLCLTCFPPSSSFNDFLQVFLRDNFEHSKKYSLVGLLCERIYRGSVQSVPTEPKNFDIRQQLTSLLKKRTPSFEEPKKTKKISYKDLMTSFAGKSNYKRRKGEKISHAKSPVESSEPDEEKEVSEDKPKKKKKDKVKSPRDQGAVKEKKKKKKKKDTSTNSESGDDAKEKKKKKKKDRAEDDSGQKKKKKKKKKEEEMD